MEIGGFSIDVGTVITVLFGFLTQSFAAWKWLAGQFSSRDASLSNIKDTLNREIARVDREVMTLRTETRERLATVPSRDQIEEMLDRKLGRLETQLDSLMQAFTRLVARRGLFREDDE
jgi:hypothetical protein